MNNDKDELDNDRDEMNNDRDEIDNDRDEMNNARDEMNIPDVFQPLCDWTNVFRHHLHQVLGSQKIGDFKIALMFYGRFTLVLCLLL